MTQGIELTPTGRGTRCAVALRGTCSEGFAAERSTSRPGFRYLPSGQLGCGAARASCDAVEGKVGTLPSSPQPSCKARFSEPPIARLAVELGDDAEEVSVGVGEHDEVGVVRIVPVDSSGPEVDQALHFSLLLFQAGCP